MRVTSSTRARNSCSTVPCAARSFSMSHCEREKPATPDAAIMTNRTMNGARLFLRPPGDCARAASSLAMENLSCKSDADKVAVAAMMAARIESDMVFLSSVTVARAGEPASTRLRDRRRICDWGHRAG